MRIILASQSKARQELMRSLGIAFEIAPSVWKEDMSRYVYPRRLALYLARGKAEFVAGKFPSAVIITADTFVTVGKIKIGKPSSLAHARKLVRRMSGQWLKVHSGVCVIRTDVSGNIVEEKLGYALTRLKIRALSGADIEQLVSQPDALEISGAFSIEGEGGKTVERIVGDYSNVIGLPMFLVKKFLVEVGIRMPY